MTVVAITSSRTSPGATTLAAGLAIVWSHLADRSLLIEADPAGGVLALRFDLAPAPSLTSFGSDIRNGFEPEALWANTQDLRGVRCMPSPVDPVLARSWVDRVSPTLIEELPRLGVPAVIDLGWVDQDGASAKLAAAADTTLVVTRPDVAEIQALLFQVRRLQTLDTNVAIVCIGDGPNDPAEIARIAGVPLAAVLPDDPKVAAALSGAKFKPAKFKRSMLWRSISGLGASLFDDVLLQSRIVSLQPSAPVEEYNGFADMRGTLDELSPDALANNQPLPTAPMELQRPQTHAPVSALSLPAGQPSAASVNAVLAPELPAIPPPPSAASVNAVLAVELPAEPPAAQPAVPEPVVSTPKAAPPARPATVISFDQPVMTAPPIEYVDPGLFEETRRMSHRMPIATLTLPTGETKTLTGTITIGRHSECDIVLNDSQVSRRHGRLVHTADGWNYSDLGSRNGTEINGHPCTDAVLGADDVLTIGRTPLTFDTTSQREMECA